MLFCGLLVVVGLSWVFVLDLVCLRVRITCGVRLFEVFAIAIAFGWGVVMRLICLVFVL